MSDWDYVGAFFEGEDGIVGCQADGDERWCVIAEDVLGEFEEHVGEAARADLIRRRFAEHQENLGTRNPPCVTPEQFVAQAYDGRGFLQQLHFGGDLFVGAGAAPPPAGRRDNGVDSAQRDSAQPARGAGDASLRWNTRYLFWIHFAEN